MCNPASLPWASGPRSGSRVAAMLILLGVASAQNENCLEGHGGTMPTTCMQCTGYCTQTCMTADGMVGGDECTACSGCANCLPWADCLGGHAADSLQPAQQEDCYMHLEADGAPCNDNDPSTETDVCFQGSCGSWVRIDTTIATESDRLEWVNSQPFLDSGCTECDGAPYTLALDASGGHGMGSVAAGVNSYMAWRHPNLNFVTWYAPDAGSAGDQTGHALFMSKFGSCANADQWGDNGQGGSTQYPGCEDADNHLQIRSENQQAVTGYNFMYVFAPVHEVQISNLVTHSQNQNTAAAMNKFQPYYTDQTYAFTTLPTFLLGLMGIKTADADLNSDPTDLEYLCFDVDRRSTIYVLYNKQATDRPTWLKSTFTNLGIATVDDNTAVEGGSMEIYYRVVDPGHVCLGGNNAPGVAHNYIVMVGPIVDLSQLPSHAVTISNLVTHSDEEYVVADVGVGDPYYIDRDYQFKTLPPFLQHLKTIKTANDDKSASAADEEWLCFDVEEPVRVYVLFDPRVSAVSPPTWLVENFADRHEEIAQSGGFTWAGGTADAEMGFFEIWSDDFRIPTGQTSRTICLGGNGCQGSCSNYIVMVGPDETEPFFPGSAAAAPRYFDGDSDYVLVPELNGGNADGNFDIITVDVWIKFHFAGGGILDQSQGELHPILCNDHRSDDSSPGNIRYQIWAGQFGLTVDGVGDGTNRDAMNWIPFAWQQIDSARWYYITLVYNSRDQYIKLWVDNVDDFGSPYVEPTIDCATCTVPVNLDSPRIGAWVDEFDTVARSLHGEISVFRIWNIEHSEMAQETMCPSANTPGLTLQYVFGPGDDTVRDLSGNENDGYVHDAMWETSDDLPPQQQCQKQGFGGYFDGDDDYAHVTTNLGSFTKLTMEFWIKLDEVDGTHPIVMEDGWDPGTMHLQIWEGRFTLSIYGVGDYVFDWQPTAGEWDFISVVYASSGASNKPYNIALIVNNVARGDNTYNGQFWWTQDSWAQTIGLSDTGQYSCPCTIPANLLPAVHFHSLRLGAWADVGNNGEGNMDRSMRGAMAVFRLWNKMKNGEDKCPASGSSGLVVNYLFDSFGSPDGNGITELKDRSGNGNDGIIHDAKFSADYPDQTCMFHSGQLYSMASPVVMGEHGIATVGCADCSHTDEDQSQPPVEIQVHQTFTNPVVIAGIPTENGGDSVVVRIQNLRRYGEYAEAGINAGAVQHGNNCDGSDCEQNGRMCTTQWCFDLFLQEPECLDNWHMAEEVSWLVMESGSYVTNELLEFKVGTTAAQGGAWDQVTFSDSFPAGISPVVLTHVQTVHDPHFAKTRQAQADRRGFQVTIEQIGTSDGFDDSGHPIDGEYIHGTETIGYVAFEPGHGHIGRIQFEAQNTEEAVTEQEYTVNFAHAFDNVPNFFGNIASHNGADASQLRRAAESSVTTAAGSFYVEEEACVDDASNGDCPYGEEYIEGNGCHPNSEVVSWLAFGAATVAEFTANNGWGADSWSGYQTVASSDDGTFMVARHKIQSLTNIGEVGSTVVNTAWTSVSLTGQYSNPVVLCSVPTQNGNNAVACRLRRLRYSPPVSHVQADGSAQTLSCPGGGWCFEICLQEVACADHFHFDEQVSWIVLEEGTWLSDDGKQFQVGTAEVHSGGWTLVSYRGTGFTSVPATLTTIQSFHGQYCHAPHAYFDAEIHCHADDASGSGYCADDVDGPQCSGVNQIVPDTYGFLKTRQRKPTELSVGTNDPYDTSGMFGAGAGMEGWRQRQDTQHFYVTLESDQTHSDVGTMDVHSETVGWAAFEQNHGSIGEMKYEAGSTPFEVDDTPYHLTYSGFFRLTPKFFGQIASYHGSDSSGLRIQDSQPAAADIYIEEENCNDDETEHPNGEKIDYFAFLAGVGSDAGLDVGGIRAHGARTSEAGTSNLRPFAESGDVTLQNEWITISLEGYYFHPVVIASPPTTSGGDPSVIRIRNVRHGNGCNGWCFDMRVQESDCNDDVHRPEHVHWLVIEAGSWSSDQGHMIQAGQLEIEGDMTSTGMQFTTVEFLGAGFPGVVPAVVTQCMSFYGSDWVKTRQQQGDSTYFSVALEEEGGLEGHGCNDCSSSAHTNWEEIGWIAVEPANGDLGTQDFEAGVTGNAVTHQDYSIPFTRPFQNPPRFFAAMQSYLGTDSAELRQRSEATASGASVFVEEETCSDDEINHVAETVGYFAVEAEPGIIYAQSNLNMGCEGVYDATSAQLVGAILRPGAPGERNCASNDAVCHDEERQDGTVGSGIIDFRNAEGDSATWDLHRCSAAHVYLIFGYSLGLDGADRPMSVKINDVTVDAYLSMPPTGSWSTFSEVRVPARLNAGQNSISLNAIGFGGPDIDYMAISPIGGAGYGETTTVGEAGVIHTIDYTATPTHNPEEQWQIVHLSGNYVDPVVVMGVPTTLGQQQAVPRVRGLRYNNVATDIDPCEGHCFEVRIQEPDCMDDLHVEEEIPYLVMEAGTWFSDTGKMFQVGRVNVAGTDAESCCTPTDTSCCTGVAGCQPGDNSQCGMNGMTGFVDVDFHTEFPDDEVSVLPQVQTYNDPSFVKARMAPRGNVAGSFATGFQVSLEEIGQNNAGSIAVHGMEAVGWMAFQHAADTIGGDIYLADTTDMRVTDDPSTGGIAFCDGFFPRAPLFFAALASREGWDAAELRLSQETTASQASIFIEEESCDDDETLHVEETVSFLAIDHGSNHQIRATATAPPRAGTAQSELGEGEGTDCGGPAPVDCVETSCWVEVDDSFCQSYVQETLDEVQDICCQTHGVCDSGFPSACSADCAGLWMPVWERCSAYINNLLPGSTDDLTAFSDSCDTTLYGGACTDGYYTQGMASMNTICSTDSATCSADCRDIFTEFTATCQDQIRPEDATNVGRWRAACLPGGGGH